MAYEKQVWQNEVLSGVSADQALFTIKNSSGTIINDDVIIELKSTEEQAGSEFTADRMNHIEDGIDANSTAFDASTGHDHDGTDSKKIAYSNVTGTPEFETSASNIKAVGTASVGSLATLARADHVHPRESFTVVWSGTSSSGSALTPSVDYVMASGNRYKCICLFGSGASFHAAEFIFNSGDTTLESVAALTKMSDSSVSGIKLVITLSTSTRKIDSITPTYAATNTSIRSISFIPINLG